MAEVLLQISDVASDRDGDKKLFFCILRKQTYLVICFAAYMHVESSSRILSVLR